jgi:mannose-1-phosphate guanylyltransferase
MNRLFTKGWNVLNTPEEKEFIDINYKESENISIDYAILEPSDSVCLVEASFDWNDLGSWGSLYDKLDKDDNQNVVINASSLLQNASGNMIRTTKDKLVVVDGLKDYIVVDKEDVLLIFPKEKDQDIKKILSALKADFGDTYS